MAEASASSYEPILQFLSVLIQPCVLGAFLVYFTFKKEVSWCSNYSGFSESGLLQDLLCGGEVSHKKIPKQRGQIST